MAKILAFWDALPMRQRLIAGLSAVAILAAVIGIARVATDTSMALLYSGLDAAAAGEVVAELEAQGVLFEVRDGAILVDAARRDALRMSLASQGLPAGGPAGYELLDTLTGFGTTSQMFDAAYWRAREGELARTITASTNIRAARVHLANPLTQPFSRAVEGSASVTVTMARGALDEAQAKAIRYLVSSAVAGITPERVAVIDSATGVVLAGDEAANERTAALEPANREAALRANIERLLEARVGPGRAIVEVNVDAEMESQTISERVVDPESQVVISTDSEESEETSQGAAPGVTVASNLPDGDVEGGGGESSRSATQSRERQNFEVSETRRERVILPGQVTKISVAAMVDGVVEAGPDGEPVWSPRPEEEMEVLRQLVQTAIGYDAERGDSVTLSSLQFTEMPASGVLVEAQGLSFIEANGLRLLQIGTLGTIVLALIFFVLRPMLGRPVPMALTELTGPRDREAEDAEQIEGLPNLPATLIEHSLQNDSRIERLRDVIASRSEESAAVLRSWIEAPEPLKEPQKSS